MSTPIHHVCPNDGDLRHLLGDRIALICICAPTRWARNPLESRASISFPRNRGCPPSPARDALSSSLPAVLIGLGEMRSSTGEEGGGEEEKHEDRETIPDDEALMIQFLPNYGCLLLFLIL